MERIKTIGENIKYYRKIKGLSIESLAEQVNISSVYLGAIERGKKPITSNVLIKILNVLDISFNEILNKTKSPEFYLRNEILSIISTNKLTDSEKEFFLNTIKIINSKDMIDIE